MRQPYTYKLQDNIQGMKAYPDKFFDLAIADPPYGIGESQRGGRRSTRNGMVKQKNGSVMAIPGKNYIKKDWDKKPTKEYFDELFRISKHQIIWGANHLAEFLPNGSCWIVWDKLTGDNDFSDCELAFTSFPGGVRKFTFMWSGMMQGKSLTEGHIQQGNKKLNEVRIHVTQKPIILYRWMLKEFALPGFRIIDPGVGSGSSIIACLQDGFDIVGFENDPDEFEKSTKRIKEFESQLVLL